MCVCLCVHACVFVSERWCNGHCVSLSSADYVACRARRPGPSEEVYRHQTGSGSIKVRTLKRDVRTGEVQSSSSCLSVLMIKCFNLKHQ